MATQIQIRRDTQTNWDTANPTLAVGEFGLVTSSNKIVALKVGDGSSAWKALEFSLPVMSGVDNTLEPNDADSAPINQVTTFSLKGVDGQTSQMLGIKKHDGTVTFSVDQDGEVVVKGDITMDADKKVLIGAASGTTTGIQIKAKTNNGHLMTRSSSAASDGEAIIHHYKNNVSTFRVDNDGDIDKCKNIDASGVITTTSNVSAVNVTGSGVLNMSATAGQHNLNDVLDMNSKKIIGVVNPTAGSQEVATANYVDNIKTGHMSCMGVGIVKVSNYTGGFSAVADIKNMSDSVSITRPSGDQILFTFSGGLNDIGASNYMFSHWKTSSLDGNWRPKDNTELGPWDTGGTVAYNSDNVTITGGYTTSTGTIHWYIGWRIDVLTSAL